MQDQQKPYTIVVGTDYSECSELALERALELAAERVHADVHIVNVIQPYGVESDALGVVPDTSEDVKEALERLRQYVERALLRFRQRQTVAGTRNLERVSSHVLVDAPATKIAQLASELEADLLVVGTHGRRGLSRLIVGSVAEKLIRLAPCEVLVVRPKGATAPISTRLLERIRTQKHP